MLDPHRVNFFSSKVADRFSSLVELRRGGAGNPRPRGHNYMKSKVYVTWLWLAEARWRGIDEYTTWKLSSTKKAYPIYHSVSAPKADLTLVM